MVSELPLYNTVVAIEDHEDSRSSTEVGESLLGDEKQLQSTKHEPRLRSQRDAHMTSWKSYQWFISLTLQLVIMAMLLLLLRPRWIDSSIMARQIGGDFSGGGPTFLTKVVKFDADVEFVPMNTTGYLKETTIAKWNTIMPVGAGWGQPNQFPFFTTTMTHQLHCLWMMGQMFSKMETGSTKDLPADYQSHYLHCIDYIRQGVMCLGDMSLEAHAETDADDNGPGDGSWSGHHVCKDYSKITSYLEEEIVAGVRTVLPIDD
ncbi:hypothetical protein BJ878DRAFT_333968 [Calycina marina]|uniref:Oxidase ustYa n=1 Tax=Calycina marina TaxID=1763456 RepID=A0A9P7YUJ7_9HELO|nr:hypothetical protein BJ878DRAFT_333968 [Calycina marina]